MTFSLDKTEAHELDDGDVSYSYSGSSEMRSAGGSNIIKLSAANELQLIALLIKITWVWVTSVSGQDTQIAKASGDIAENPLDAFA